MRDAPRKFRGPLAGLAILGFLASGSGAPAATARVPNADPPEATPTPSPAIDSGARKTDEEGIRRTPRLVASLETSQGIGSERTALFDDGTVAHTVTHRGRALTERRTLAPEELDVVRRVTSEALGAARDGESLGARIVTEASARRVLLVLSGPDGERSVEISETSALPLAVGRARAALEELRARFWEKTTPKEQMWDPAPLREGDVVRRRSDGAAFHVAGDDLHGGLIELLDERELERMLLKRSDVPKLFFAPSRLAAEK